MMITRRNCLALAFCLLAAFSGLPGARAASLAEGAGQHVKNLADEAIRTITEQGISEDKRKDEFRTLLYKGFDVPAIGRFVLGRYWRQATDPQRKEYMQLFEKLIVDTYAARFRDYHGEKLKITQVLTQGDTDAIVQSQIMRPAGGPPLNIEWRVRKEPSGFRIVDVAVEGVSMAVTQRSEFAAVIQNHGGGVESLLAALRNKTSTLDTPISKE